MPASVGDMVGDIVGEGKSRWTELDYLMPDSIFKGVG